MNIDIPIFYSQETISEPQAGSLLIAEPLLKEPWFQRSVIYVLEHGKEGTMGLVLNKPISVTLNTVLHELSDVAPIPLYCGGPVGSNKLFYMHTLGRIIPHSLEICDGLYIDGDFGSIVEYVKSDHYNPENIKFFIGYTGWSEGQLDEELSQQFWAVDNSNCYDGLMTARGEKYWKSRVRGLGAEFHTWLFFPKEIGIN